MSNIAIFGGTFNPFHIGHYEMLASVCNLSFVDKVLVVPDKLPPHKAFDKVVNDVHRQNMCAIVCDDFSKAELCLVEFDRDGKSYTVDTVKQLKKKYPNDTFYIVIGGDMLTTLDTWYNWQELFTLASFIAFKRDGVHNIEDTINRLRTLGADITFVECNITDVSKAIMIGDRKHDIIGAKKTSMASIGVLYGYGSVEELTAAGADYIAEGVSDIAPIIL